MTPSERSVIALTHEKGCLVEIVLPADMETVAEALMALGKAGFIIPAAVGAKTMTVEAGR